MLPCVIADLIIIKRLSHRTSVPCVLHPGADTAASSSAMRSQRRVGKKEGRALRNDQVEIDVWVWPVAGRRPGTRVDFRKASALAAAPSFPRQEEKKIDLDATRLRSCRLRLSSFVLCTVPEDCAHGIERERERETTPYSFLLRYSYGGKPHSAHTHASCHSDSTWRQPNIPRRSLPRWMGSLRQL